MHFRVYVQNGNIVLGVAKISNIFLSLPDIFVGYTVDAGSQPSHLGIFYKYRLPMSSGKLV